MARRPLKKKPPSTLVLMAGAVEGGLAGVATGAGVGATVGALFAKVAFITAFVDPTQITPIVLGTIGGCVGAFLKYQEKKSKGGKS